MKKTYKCTNCGDPFLAREADRKRGWARFCSKSCKAITQTRRTGRGKPIDRDGYIGGGYSRHYDDFPEGWDEHKGQF